MIALAWILALTAATRVLVVDEVYTIPADQWRYVELELKQQPAQVLAHYEVGEGTEVAVALMRHDDLENLRQDLPHGAIATSSHLRAGILRAEVAPGDYVIVVDNQANGGHPASVRLRVWFDFSKLPVVDGLSPERQLTVILVSFTVFFAIVGFATRKLWRATKRGRGSGAY
jgi:hypothetical protein